MENASFSQVKVQWYRTSTQSLVKSRYRKAWLKEASWRKIVIVCQHIRTIFSIWVQWIYNFQFPLQRTTCFYAMRDRQWLVPYDACGTNQLEAQLLAATFVKGLCRGTISLYLDLWRCRCMYKTINIIIKIGYMWNILVKFHRFRYSLTWFNMISIKVT